MTTFDDGDLRIDFDRREVTVRGKPVDLTPAEYRMLAALALHEGELLSGQQLEALYRDDDAPRSAWKFDVVRLRRKMGWTGAAGYVPLEHLTLEGYRYRSRGE